jgi:hypothetical protein
MPSRTGRPPALPHNVGLLRDCWGCWKAEGAEFGAEDMIDRGGTVADRCDQGGRGHTTG